MVSTAGSARNHTAYHSKILVQRTGAESVPQVGVGPAKQACSGNRTTTASTSATFGFSYAGFPQGLDIALYIGFPDGGHWVLDTAGTLPQSTSDKSGCLGYTLDAAPLGQDTMPVGTYQLQLLAGPSLTPVGATAVVHITAPATPPAGGGSSTGAGH